MKKYIFLVALIIAAMIYNIFPHKNTRVLRIGVECDHAPYNWEENISSDTNFSLANYPGFFVEGYDVQIAKLVADKINAKIEFYKIEWDNLIDALIEGRIDAIFSGMVDTYERKRRIIFSDPYEVVKTEYVIVVNTKSKYRNAKTLRDFNGAKILAQKGSRFDEVIDQIPGVQHMPSIEEQHIIFDEVIRFNVDGTVVNYDTGLSYSRRFSNLKLIRFYRNDGFDLGFNGLCAGLRKTDLKLLSEINSAIDSISMNERQNVMDHVIKRLWENN
ncbi:MAG: transporter substrate-binding domain-containing protein [Synergistaceae bacterium]|nr:transporter substrate-binding domain-containing protein [Synergistaceae bacterium]